MLTRLRVRGFKNLVEVDLRFGTFTCIAGANGVGKSNLFDAIQFLSLLADHSLIEAAQSIRSDDARQGDFRSVFHHTGNTWAERIEFEAEMLIPAEGVDDFGQRANATRTFVRYRLALKRRPDGHEGGPGIEVAEEELVAIKARDTRSALPFATNRDWIQSVAKGAKGTPYISTEKGKIRLRSDMARKGRPREFPTATLVRPVLMAANATENPTAVLVRRELQSWRRLQLEPTAMRKPDDFVSPSQIGMDGSHLPATLARLAGFRRAADLKSERAQNVLARITNRLAELTPGIRAIELDADEKRQQLSILLTDGSRTRHLARELSDGTLRFLALAILEQDPQFQGLLCLEEPENGIHPARVEPMIELLRSIAVDTSFPVGDGNTLRQVMVNTHSPSIVQLIDAEDLLYASAGASLGNSPSGGAVNYAFMAESWRSQVDRSRTISKANLLAYLNPTGAPRIRPADRVRVRDRPELQMMLALPQDPSILMVHERGE